MHFSEAQNLLVIKTEATFGAALVCYMWLKTTTNYNSTMTSLYMYIV